MPPQVSSVSQKRFDLISAIEEKRSSKVLTYFLSDRTHALAQIAEDAVRPMYEHLLSIKKARKIDLFLYSVGGMTDVPWRIVTMIREFTDEFNVLIPYKSMSAATMIALGADQIVMGKKGELGPIDPQLSIRRQGEGGTPVQEQIAAEDLMSYIRFLKDKAGLSDQAALAGPIAALANKMDPRIIGQMNRAHSHIRSVARKLLTARARKQAFDEQTIQVIVEALAEKTYQHGHAIGRREAKEIGLNIVKPQEPLDTLLWELFEVYEDLCKLRQPIEPLTFIPPNEDEYGEKIIMGCIESANLAHHFSSELKFKRNRQVPPQLTLNINLNVQLPPNVQPDQIPAAAQTAIQQITQQFQQQVEQLVKQQIRGQMPITGIQGSIQEGAWRKLDDWPTAVSPRSG